MKQYRKYILTFTIEITILLLGMLVYKLVNEKFDKTQFTEYNLFRRSTSLFVPLLMCGLGVSIPKFSSRYINRDSILVVGYLILASIVAFFGVLFMIFREDLSFLLMGSKSYSYYIGVLILTLFGAGSHSIVYGFLRGKFSYGWANFVQLINIGIVPIGTVYFFSNIYDSLFFNALIWLIVSLITFILLLFKYKPVLTKTIIKHDFKRLLYFGVPRVPGDFALLLLISVPSFVVLHFYNDFILSGYVSFGTTLLNLVGAAFGPIGLILLPETNKLIKSKEISKLKMITKRITIVTFLITAFGTVLFFFFSEFFLQILLSDTSEILIRSCQLMLLSSFGYALYLNLRSILDAYYFRPVNSYNLIKALLVLLLLLIVVYLNKWPFEFVIYAYVVSMFYLGLLTYLKVRTILKNSL